MRIYEGSPRRDFEEVFRSIGAALDERGMREILVLEMPDGFVVQALGAAGSSSSAWSETMGSFAKETLTFLDDEIARFMDEAAARRRGGDAQPSVTPGARPGGATGGEGATGSDDAAGSYARALRVIGRWIDAQAPKDVFLFEQDGAYVVRLLVGAAGNQHHEIAEFTREDVEQLVTAAPSLRVPATRVAP